MADKTDILIQELLALDPELARREADIRALVSMLTKHKPDVVIDETFVETLRTELMTTHRAPVVSPYMKLNWWALRLVPIGAVALLFFILAPQELHYIEEMPVLMDESAPTEVGTFESTSLSDDDAIRAKSGAPQSTGVGGESTNALRMEADMYSDGGGAPDRFDLGRQSPGTLMTLSSVTLTRTGFIVIHAFGAQGVGPVVGVGPLQNPGTTNNVPVYLRNFTHHGETYYAALYYDNGDRIFGNNDPVVTNPYTGETVSTRFTIGFEPPR